MAAATSTIEAAVEEEASLETTTTIGRCVRKLHGLRPPALAITRDRTTIPFDHHRGHRTLHTSAAGLWKSMGESCCRDTTHARETITRPPAPALSRCLDHCFWHLSS